MNVRPFRDEDAKAVAGLWRYWFHDKVRGPAPRLEALARALYLERPGTDPEIPSLVAEDGAGHLAAFLGVTVTRVRIDDREGRMVGLFPPLVDPELAPTTVAALLLRRFLTGPQDLTVSDGGHPKFERIWEALGGRIDPLASLRWIKVLRPTGLALDRSGLGAFVRRSAAPLTSGLDAVARRLAPGALTSNAVPLSGGRSEPLAHDLDVREATPEAWHEVVEALRGRAQLRPVYDPNDLRWLFAQMAEIRALHPLRIATAHGPSGRPVGAWVASMPRSGAARVFALDATDRSAAAVFAALLADADAAGVGAIFGRLGPRWRRPAADARCWIHAGGSLRMVHARDVSLMDDALLGRTAFSRLDAEGWYWWAIEDEGAEDNARSA